MTNCSKLMRSCIATAITATVAVSVVAPYRVSAFYDVSSKYEEAVEYLHALGIEGFSSTHFGVDTQVKRVDAAVMLATVLDLDLDAAPPSGFRDVPKRAEKHINALKEAGITKGTSPATFNSNAMITRGEMAIWLERAFHLSGTSQLPFEDVPDQYKASVTALYDNNVTKGISSTKFGTGLALKRGDFANFLLAASRVKTGLQITNAKYISPTQVQVTLNKAADKLSAANFHIEGLTIKSAKVDSNKRTATLTVNGMEFDRRYTVEVMDVIVDGQLSPTVSSTFVSAAAEDMYLTGVEAKYLAATQVQVTLDKPADKLSVANFHIDGLIIKSVKADSNKRTATLTVNGMEFDRRYTVNVENVMVDGQVSPTVTSTFVSAAAEDVYQLFITHKGLKENKDRTTETELTIELINKETGKVERGSSGIILDLYTSSGELAQTNIPLKSGTAKVKIVFPPSGRVSTPVINARVSSGAGIYSGLAGEISGSLRVTVNPTIDSTPFTLINANGFLNGSGRDTAIMTFSEGVQMTGTHDATNHAHYTINGNSLPYGTKITVQDSNNNTIDGFEVVILSLPDGTLNSGSNSIKIKETLQSYDGTVISEPFSRYFLSEDDWINTNVNDWSDTVINTAGTFTGNVLLQPPAPSSAGSPLKSVTYGPATGLRTLNGDVVIDGNDIENITFKNLKISGNVYIKSPVNSINTLATVAITGETRIQTTAATNGDVLLKNKGKLGTIWIDYNTLGTTIVNENGGQIATVVVNTEKPVTLEGAITNVNLQAYASMYISGTVSHLAAYQSGVINGTGRIGNLTGPSLVYLTGNNPYIRNASAIAKFDVERNRILSRNLITDEYTTESWEALQDALAFDVRDKTTLEIEKAKAALIESENELAVDTSYSVYINAHADLESLIDSLQIDHDNAIEGTELGQYRAGSKRTLQLAIYDAKGILDKNNVTPSELRAAEQRLLTAAAVFNGQRN
ncbi:MAG: S-layer homology domain-containing protein [Bacillus sp. (in: firmicutes)]